MKRFLAAMLLGFGSTSLAWAHPGHGRISAEQEPIKHYIIEPFHFASWLLLILIILAVGTLRWKALLRRREWAMAGRTINSADSWDAQS